MNILCVFFMFFLEKIPQDLQEIWSEIDSVNINLDLHKDKVEQNKISIREAEEEANSIESNIEALTNKKNQFFVLKIQLEEEIKQHYSRLSSVLNASLKDKQIIPSWFMVFGYEKNLDAYQEKVKNMTGSISSMESSLSKVSVDIGMVEDFLSDSEFKKDGVYKSISKKESELSASLDALEQFNSTYKQEITNLWHKRNQLELEVDAETILTYRGARWELPLYKPCEGRLSSPFDPKRLHPVLGYVRPHNGQDIAAPKGTPVYAAETGRVIFVGERGGNWAGLGKFVIIQHAEGWTTRYAHLSKILIDNEKAVKRGDLIGLVGSTGLSTGPHLHFETRKNDIPYDPQPYLKSDEK
ncbi:hypothetical protein CL645_03600 [bacterium]|nr:hypothetical protein [bacterium]